MCRRLPRSSRTLSTEGGLTRAPRPHTVTSHGETPATGPARDGIARQPSSRADPPPRPHRAGLRDCGARGPGRAERPPPAGVRYRGSQRSNARTHSRGDDRGAFPRRCDALHENPGSAGVRRGRRRPLRAPSGWRWTRTTTCWRRRRAQEGLFIAFLRLDGPRRGIHRAEPDVSSLPLAAAAARRPGAVRRQPARFPSRCRRHRAGGHKGHESDRAVHAQQSDRRRLSPRRARRRAAARRAARARGDFRRKLQSDRL